MNMRVLWLWSEQLVPLWARGLMFSVGPDGWIYGSDENSEEYLMLFPGSDLPEVKALKKRVADLEQALTTAEKKAKDFRQLSEEAKHEITRLDIELTKLGFYPPEQDND